MALARSLSTRLQVRWLVWNRLQLLTRGSWASMLFVLLLGVVTNKLWVDGLFKTGYFHGMRHADNFVLLKHSSTTGATSKEFVWLTE